MESTTSEALAICTLKQENLREFSNTILTDYFQSCYQKKNVCSKFQILPCFGVLNWMRFNYVSNLNRKQKLE